MVFSSALVAADVNEVVSGVADEDGVAEEAIASQGAQAAARTHREVDTADNLRLLAYLGSSLPCDAVLAPETAARRG